MSTLSPDRPAPYRVPAHVTFQSDFTSPEWERRFRNGELPHETYEFVGSHYLTQNLDMAKLMPHDVLDEMRTPVKLELEPATLAMMTRSIDEVFSHDSDKVDYDAFVAERVTTTARHLRPKLVKEEIAARRAGQHLDDIYYVELMRRSRVLDRPMDDLETDDLRRGIVKPSTTIMGDFGPWSSREWTTARDEAIDLLLDHIDPAYANEFQHYAGRELAVEQIETSDLRERAVRFGRGIVSRFVRVAA